MATVHVRVPAEDRRLQIIEIAGDLFASRGYEGTTTRELAERVGINEALLFRHFATKDDLYWAVLQHMIDKRGTKDRLSEHVRAGMTDRETFVAVAKDLLNRNVQLTRLLFYSVLEKHELSDRFFSTHVIAYHEILADYIREGIKTGRFRDMDPVLAARAFIGMFSYHYQIHELFGGKVVRHFDPDEVVNRLVDIWLEGMKPRAQRARKAPRTRSRRVAEKVAR